MTWSNHQTLGSWPKDIIQILLGRWGRGMRLHGYWKGRQGGRYFGSSFSCNSRCAAIFDFFQGVPDLPDFQKMVLVPFKCHVSLIHINPLVGGLEHGFYFSIYWEESSHLTNSYFWEGLKPPTSPSFPPTLRGCREPTAPDVQGAELLCFPTVPVALRTVGSSH